MDRGAWRATVHEVAKNWSNSLSCIWLFCYSIDYNPPGSPVHGILQARILEWVAISFFRQSPDPGIKLRSPALAGGFFITITTWETVFIIYITLNPTHCQSRTIKRVECWRIDAFELWCWRRLLRVPWTATRFNQSILKEINREYSLEGLMLDR